MSSIHCSDPVSRIELLTYAVIVEAIQQDNFQGHSRSSKSFTSVFVCRKSPTTYRNACLILVSAPVGRYVTLPIATASAAAAVAAFTRLLTATPTVRHQQSQRRQALTLTWLTPTLVLTSHSQWHVLSNCLLTYLWCRHTLCIWLMKTFIFRFG